MKLNKLITMLVFVLALPLTAQQTLTLEESINIALQHNLDIKVAKNENISANNNINIGNAGFLPSVNLTASTSYSDNEINSSQVLSNYSSTSNTIGISASYTLFDGLNNFASYEKLKSQGKMSDYQTQNMVEQNIIQVTNTYYTVAGLTEQLKILKESVIISRDRLARTENKKNYGQAKSVEYLSALVDFNRDSVSYIGLHTSLAQAKQDLNYLLNRDIDHIFDVELEVVYKDIPPSDELIELAKENNALYKVSSKNINFAKSNIKSAKSGFLPKLSIDANYNYNKTNDEFDLSFLDKNRGFTTSLNLSYNLFNGFRDDIKTQNAEIELKISDLERNREILSLITEITNVYQQYEDSKTSLKLENANLESAELNFERSRELYNLGNLTNTQFRESQLNLIQAKYSITTLKYSIKAYESELERLAGILI